MLPPSMSARNSFSLTNMADRYIAVTGGEDATVVNRRGDACRDNYRFDLQASKWEKLPNWQTGIKMHGSCCIDGNLYVFCGLNSGDDALNTIQLLEDACSSLDLMV